MTLLDEFESSDDDTVEEEFLEKSLDENNPVAECRSLIWHCFSKVLESGIKYIKGPDDIYSQLTPILFKAVFHGGFKSMWSSVMEVEHKTYIFCPGIIDHMLKSCRYPRCTDWENV